MAEAAVWINEEAAAEFLDVPRWAFVAWPQTIGLERRENPETYETEYEQRSLERLLARYSAPSEDRTMATARLRNAANLQIIAESPIGVGWMPIVLRLYGNLLQTDPGIGLQQVKEKFGGLRVYYEPGTAEQAAILRMHQTYQTAVEEAARTCELCGSWQDVSTSSSDPRIHWIRTLCERHHQMRRAAAAREAQAGDG